MKAFSTFVMALSAIVVLPSALASGATGQQAEPVPKTGDAGPAAKPPALPPKDTGDAKGKASAEPQQEPKDGAKAAGGKKHKPMRPHSHPQDGKGMYVPEKK